MRISKTQGSSTIKYYWDRGYIAYGMAGAFLGFSDQVLFMTAGIVNALENRVPSSWLNLTYYGDDPYDQFCIRVGIDYYYSGGMSKWVQKHL